MTKEIGSKELDEKMLKTPVLVESLEGLKTHIPNIDSKHLKVVSNQITDLSEGIDDPEVINLITTLKGQILKLTNLDSTGIKDKRSAALNLSKTLKDDSLDEDYKLAA